jgi:hypothetical protein
VYTVATCGRRRPTFFGVPYVVALVELDDNRVRFANIADIDVGRWRAGMRGVT